MFNDVVTCTVQRGRRLLCLNEFNRRPNGYWFSRTLNGYQYQRFFGSSVVETRSFPKWHGHQDEGGKPDKIRVHVALATRQRRRDHVITQIRHTCQQSWEIPEKGASTQELIQSWLSFSVRSVGPGSWCFPFGAPQPDQCGEVLGA